MELIFEIRDADEGSYNARALGHAMFTRADTSEELRGNVLEAVSLHFEDAAVRPRIVQASLRQGRIDSARRGMKLPRGQSAERLIAERLIKALERVGYVAVHQKGSHVKMRNAVQRM